ncbi:MAG: homoaconitate hydratase [Candidatus Helarchaeota archaeon]|nr:homoaconitate hydratase [Candidatus Helarchaeota archaeon]
MREIISNNELLYNYNHLKINNPNQIPEKIYIWDETLRDGEQTPGVNLSFEQKLDIAKLLDEIGVSVIAVGFPAVSESEKKIVNEIAKEKFRAKIAAPARAKISDIDDSLQCDIDEIPIFFPTSKLALKKVLNKDINESMKIVSKAIEYAVDHGVITDFVAMDASRTEFDMLLNFFHTAIDSGVNKIIIADTVGIMRPLAMSNLIKNLRENEIIKKSTTSIHAHNDFGLAVSNTLAGIEMGANFPHVCVNGYGERSGNASLEEMVLALEILYNKKTLKKEKIFELSKLVEEYFGLPISVHHPVTGFNSFCHESGLHVDAILRGGPETIEPFDPRIIGRQRHFYMGKFSGRKNIEWILDKLGIKANPEQVLKILYQVKSKDIRNSIKKSKELMNLFEEKINQTYRAFSALEFLKIVEEVTKQKISISKLTEYNEVI